MKNTSKKHTTKLQSIPMQELRVMLENELHRHNYLTYLTNLTENDLILKITKLRKKPTILSLVRYRHRPLEVEINVDYTLLESYDLIKTRKKTSPSRRQNTPMFRWIWIGLILLSVILSVIGVILSVLINLIELVTPGWSSIQRSFGLIAIAILIFFWWQVGRHRYQEFKDRNRGSFDYQILGIVVNYIESVVYNVGKIPIVRCWSCFEKIDRNENFCLHCGNQQK